MVKTSNSCIICPMKESDLDVVLSIETDSFPYPWSRVHFVDELHSPYSFPMIALDTKGILVGYICPMVLLDEGHILNVAVRREVQGSGIGRLMIETVIRVCRERGSSFVSLEVRPSNASAISLYLRLGFKETGRRKKYYENGEDAVLMEYIFPMREERCNAV